MNFFRRKKEQPAAAPNVTVSATSISEALDPEGFVHVNAVDEAYDDKKPGTQSNRSVTGRSAKVAGGWEMLTNIREIVQQGAYRFQPRNRLLVLCTTLIYCSEWR